MAKKAARKRAPAAEGAEDKSSPALDKIAGLLALIATKELDTDTAALKLVACGFSAREISGLLDVGPNYVNVARHRKKNK
ncbi:hypothetical protein [Bradyrhizobium sp. WSM1253]|jgi:hypothetical protein|uniref:hypothetical protein n=1 Tax=Bradyrhizobium TaxID=374 RepID=UPI00025D2E3C|nr:hypothetical protein [Bradyrhizobium sp. WSM1253]EIG62917.1 hypothetical protein Bra1253DRAFT_07862 [Bradyrhizobium sp. WSM1253]